MNGKEKATRFINEFLKVFSSVTGILIGFTFFFYGLINSNTTVALLALVSLICGLVAASTMVNEKDEYETSLRQS